MEKIEFINKENLKWAREKSGFDWSHIYKKSGWKPERKKIEKWEAGEDFPTISELRNLGEVYKRPWTLFIIKQKASDLKFKFLEFRKIFGAEQSDISPHLLEFLNEMKKKQDFLMEFADALDLGINQLVGKCKEITEETQMAEQLILHVGIDMETFRKKKTRRDGFNYLIECLEQKNIFITSTSSHHKKQIPLEQMRGVLLNSGVAPIIGINTKDKSYGARLFTIFHELAHLLGEDSFQNGIEVTKIDFRERKSKDEKESFCNEVAARALIPDTVLSEIKSPITKEFVEKKCKELKVNHEPLLYRMQKFGLLNEKEVNELLKNVREDRIDQQKKVRNKKKGGPDGGHMKLLQNGRAFVHAINALHSQGEITFTQALNVLDVKASAYKKFAGKI